VAQQTDSRVDVGCSLNVKTRLEPVEKRFNRLPFGTDKSGSSITGYNGISFAPLSQLCCTVLTFFRFLTIDPH
jgi:hypothetical protein